MLLVGWTAAPAAAGLDLVAGDASAAAADSSTATAASSSDEATMEIIGQSTASSPQSSPAAEPIPVVTLVMILVGLAVLGLVVLRRWWRLDARPLRRQPTGWPGALLLMGAMILLGAVGQSVLVWIRWPDGPPAGDALGPDDRALLLAAGLGAQMIPVAIWGVLVVLARRRAEVPGAAPPASMIRAVIVGIAALLVVWPVLQMVAFVGSRIATLVTGEVPDPQAHDMLQMLRDQPRDVWFFTSVALVTTVGPIKEEVMYRALLQGALRQVDLGPWPAILVVSVLFTGMHAPVMPLHALPALFLLSIGFGWAYERTGRLLAPIVMHILFNIANIAITAVA